MLNLLNYRVLKHSALGATVVAAIVSSGCTSPIHILKPDRNNPYDPVTRVELQFDTNFNPSLPWHAELDGVNLSGFTPAPAPGKISSVPIVITGASVHTIKATATCGTFCVYNSDEFQFWPPALVYNSTTYANVKKDLTQFQPASAFVGVQNFRTVPINVTVVEKSSPKRVKLAAPGGQFQAPGSPITLTIPANTTKADFLIQGDVLGSYVLEFTAPGVVTGGGSGNVRP